MIDALAERVLQKIEAGGLSSRAFGVAAQLDAAARRIIAAIRDGEHHLAEARETLAGIEELEARIEGRG